MKDEIKEIIRKRKEKINLNKSLHIQGYYDEEDELLLDYITNLQTIEREYSAILSENANLQQENERLKIKIKTQIRNKKKQTHKKNIYKVRCKKALEIIESYEMGKYDYSIPPWGIIELKDVLQGETND